jgi:sortase (surface protein transpeptidase)
MSGIRYTISGLMLFFIFKISSLEILDNKKRKQKAEKIQTSTKQQQKKNKNPNLLQIKSSRRKQCNFYTIIIIHFISNIYLPIIYNKFRRILVKLVL